MNRNTRWLVVATCALIFLSGCLAAVPGTNDSTSETSIQFENATEASGLDYESVKGGGAGNGNEGVYVADVDRNGWEDVLLMGGDRPALFTNRNGTFERSGQLDDLEHEYRAAAFVDFDGDGWRDLVLFGRDKPAVAYENDEGTLTRTDVGLGNFTYPLGATAADFTGNGNLDLFVYQSGYWGDGNPAGYFAPSGYLEEDNGNPNYLYENVGGEFERVDDAGMTGDHWSLAASAVDFNDDDAPDIHVANDFYYDEVYLNQGDGTFEHRYMSNATDRNGMSSTVADVDRNGHPDVFATNIYLPLKEEMSQERYNRLERYFQFVVQSDRTKGNTLSINDGNGNFTEEAAAYGVQEGGWGWAATFSDFNNDGNLDLLQATELVVRLDQEDPHYSYPMLFRGNASDDGFTNLDASDHGLKETDGRGLVALDYDNDGALEVVSTDVSNEVVVYDNVGTTGNSFQFTAVESSGAPAFGATVTVTADGESTVIQQTDQRDFHSQESMVRHVGTGDTETVDVEVQWPDGSEQTFEDVDANQRVRISKDGLETLRTFDDD